MYGKSTQDLEAERADFKRWQKIVADKKGWFASDPRLTGSLISVERANQETTVALTQVNMHIVKVPYRLGRVDKSMWNQGAIHYQVKIWIAGDEKRAYVFQYSQGSGVKQFPTIREILFSFVQDALMGAESFSNYCGNTGEDSDSIQASRNYEQCNEVFGWFQLNRVYESQLVRMAGNLQEAENRGDINLGEIDSIEIESIEDDNPF